MEPPTHCFICPTYGNYDYAKSSIESFCYHTKNGAVVVVDDGHPEFFEFWEYDARVVAHRFNRQGGLTRSWNYGLRMARDIGAQYAICGNDDILFVAGWEAGPAAILENPAVGVVGPLSNSPGLSNREQNIWDYIGNYSVSDAYDDLFRTSDLVKRKYKASDYIPVEAINGFFMIGRTARWWEGSFDSKCIFNPASQFALVDSEHELQARFRFRGWKSAVSLSSFIFHYRSVSRGNKHVAGKWFRKKK